MTDEQPTIDALASAGARILRNVRLRTMTLRVLTHRGDSYVRVDDVAAYLREAGSTHEDPQAFEHVAVSLVAAANRAPRKRKGWRR